MSGDERVPRRRPSGPAWLIIVSVGVVVIVGGLIGVARYGPLTSVGRMMIEARLTGLKVGRFGRLRIEGVRGDIWRSFTVSRLSIADRRGIWLDARGLAVRWHWSELLGRRLHMDFLSARTVTVIRRPILGPAEKPTPMPVSIQIDDARARVEMLPALSLRRGVYDIRTAFSVERFGGALGQGTAESVLHPGDHLHVRFDVGRSKAFTLAADAREASGGALAGALGLAADRPFSLTANAAGSMAAGRFTLDSRIGGLVPIQGAGAWNKAGGSADAHLVLAASSLLSPWRRMLGPDVRFHLAGTRAADGFYALAVNAASQNAALTARGEADIGRRSAGPKGVALDLRIIDTGRVLAWPRAGSARIVGGLGGDAGHWVLAGNASLDRPNVGAYSLARLAGPVRLEMNRRELSIKAAANGSGGAGRGLLAALLGGRPSGSAELTRFADGRLLMRRLAVAGPGLAVVASGTRGLLGGLSFKGDATVSNLAAARPGAAGVVRAAWSASQGAPGQPWSIGFDARGQRFTSGMAELDRLLGANPRLAAQGDWRDGTIAVARSTLTGAAGTLGSAGLIGADGGLKLALDWRAAGPFEIGPLEIAGAAKGGGALTGTLAAPRADLMADFAAIDLPYVPLRAANVTLSLAAGQPGGADGHLAVAADSPYGPAKAAAAFRFAPAGLDLSEIAVEAGGVSAAGALALRRGAPSSADLTLAARPGAVISEGRASGRVRIVDAPGGARGDLVLDVEDAVPTGGGVAIKSMKITADGPLAHLPYRADGEGLTTGGPWKIAGDGVLDASPEGGGLTFSGGGRLRRAEFRTLSPALFRFGGKVSGARLALAVGGGRADLDVASTAGAFSAKATLAAVDLGLLNQDFTGRFDADLTLAGRGPSLSGEFQAKLIGAGGRDLKGRPPVDGVIRAHLAGGAIRLDASLANGQGLAARADLTLPAEASAAPFRIAVDRRRPMRGAFSIDGEVGPIWDLLMGGDRSLAGRLAASGTLGGTLADPRALGTATLSDGRFHDAATGLKLSGVTLDATLADNAVDVAKISGNDGVGGRIAGAGRISLLRQGVSDFRLDLTRFRLIDNDTAQAAATGQASVSRGADGRVKLTGALTIDQAQIAANPPIPSGVVPMDVVEIHRPLELDERFAPGAGAAAPVALDIGFRSPGRIFLKGRGLNLELSLDAHVGGTTAAPVLTGAARVVRGDYDFAGKRFTVDDHGVVTLGSTAEAIRLDLTASREDPTITAVIRIQGTAARPRITLSSTPVLPTDEVLSQVLFGASASGLSGGEAAQLASALAAMAGGGGFDLMGGLRNFAHLDRLAFAGTAATGTTIAGGKYLRENLYLEVSGGGREGAAAQLEWRARKHLSVVSKLGTSQGENSLEVRWRKDY